MSNIPKYNVGTTVLIKDGDLISTKLSNRLIGKIEDIYYYSDIEEHIYNCKFLCRNTQVYKCLLLMEHEITVIKRVKNEPNSRKLD